jgi:sulfite reductase (NADPH) hemoprotein beta-component
VRHNADPLLSVLRPVRAGKLTTVTTSSSILIRAIPHLYKLANFPVVIHVSLSPAGYSDYSEISAIRNCGFSFLQSDTLQEVQDIGLTAHALAIKSGKGVIHFFGAGASSTQNQAVPALDLEAIRKIVDVDAARLFQSTDSEET